MIKTIYCSVLKRIKIHDEVINDLVFTLEFQRLNRIKQLGVVHYLFPGATHTRFSHSLGAYELSRRMLRELSQANNISSSQQMIIKVSALLHDIGHGPLSHLFEELNQGKNHEQYTIDIIQSSNTEINAVLKKYLSSDEIDQVVLIILKKHPIKWMNQIISSDIDVDRLDYLLRDSYNTGVEYGNFDLEWLIQNVILYEDKLGFSEKSLQTLESIILGRYHMYTRVYLNPKNLAFSEQFKFLINHLRNLTRNNYSFKNSLGVYERLLKMEPLDFDNILMLNDDNFFTLIQNMYEEDDLILKKITRNILRGNLPKIIELKTVLEYTEFMNSNSKKKRNIEYSVIELDNNFNSFHIAGNEEPMILANNNQLTSISDISTIITSKNTTKNNKLTNKKIGILI